jgi:uncharacterized protein YeaO (DUF488 family)
MQTKIKRVYDQPAEDDGLRILVDRLWPRGLTKEKAHVDLWLKDIAPSTGLRKWFGHEPAKWEEFKKKYLLELKENDVAVSLLKDKARETVTLLYGAKDHEHNEAIVLLDYLGGQ